MDTLFLKSSYHELIEMFWCTMKIQIVKFKGLDRFLRNIQQNQNGLFDFLDSIV